MNQERLVIRWIKMFTLTVCCGLSIAPARGNPVLFQSQTSTGLLEVHPVEMTVRPESWLFPLGSLGFRVPDLIHGEELSSSGWEFPSWISGVSPLRHVPQFPGLPVFLKETIDVDSQEESFLPQFSLKSLLPPRTPNPPWIWLMAGAGGGLLIFSLIYHGQKRNRSILPTLEQTLPLSSLTADVFNREVETEPLSANPENLVEENSEVQTPTPLRRIGIVETLIQDLQSRDPIKRRQSIWELGQLGDSRAIQPLVDLTLDSDSAQRSLILAALSEIGVRALKPMNRALAISLQDENPEVRKNAIRDLTRVYDLMAQVAQLLNHASADGDREVRETAHWAMGKLDRLHTLAGRDLSALPSAEPPLPQDES